MILCLLRADRRGYAVGPQWPSARKGTGTFFAPHPEGTRVEK